MSERQVKIGNLQIIPHITSLAFSRLGDLLYVYTITNDTHNYLFVCNFTATIRNEDCITKMSLGNDVRILLVKTNSANKIAISAGL